MRTASLRSALRKTALPVLLVLAALLTAPQLVQALILSRSAVVQADTSFYFESFGYEAGGSLVLGMADAARENLAGNGR